MSDSPTPRALRRAVFARDNGRCQYCGVYQFGSAATFHVDHIIPRSAGGLTVLENLALQCPYCSVHKSNAMSAVDPHTGAPVRLFHPRRDSWAEHFRLRPDATLEGLTPIGRATIAALGMNDELQRIARFLQVVLGLL